MVESSEIIEQQIEKRRDPGSALVFWALVAVSVPFFLGAIVLGAQFFSPTTSNLGKAFALEALLFAFGFGLGLVGAAYTITSKTPQRRILATAATLFGCSHIALGLGLRSVTASSYTHTNASIVPLLPAVVMWIYSLYLALLSPARLKEEQPEAETEESTEEQPQLLSRP